MRDQKIANLFALRYREGPVHAKRRVVVVACLADGHVRTPRQKQFEHIDRTTADRHMKGSRLIVARHSVDVRTSV